MPARIARAVWHGSLEKGHGELRTDSGTFNSAYSWSSRFEDGEGRGTNPEELIGAAHAGCFSMALAGILVRAGFKPETIRTEARVFLNREGQGWRIARIELLTEGDVPGMSEEAFASFADQAKADCPVSKALTGVEIVVRTAVGKDEYKT